FFTVFVMLQFWNMFNARAFGTDRSAFNLRGCSGFLFIALSIVVGQVIIVTFGGEFFSVVPLSLRDWLLLSAATSLVLWIGEEGRALRRR
ncbi:MAG: cation transporting ATPase C-terminal domain-containing protein, partial [Muribaculaceae bacterium]|nr:cation transporting ATPase C-terminal domain-containing protein [Muribaculaceae bacterium]